MKILTIDNYSLNPTKAVIFRSKYGREYYNIRIGNFVRPFKGISICLDVKDFPVTSDEITLLGKDYKIKPIVNKKNLKFKTDKVGNTLFSIEKIKFPSQIDENELLVLFSPPFNKTQFLSYEVKGTVELLLEGVNGVIWLDKTYKSPTHVFLIYGDCEISYTYINRENKKEKLTFKRFNLEESLVKEIIE